MSRRYPTAELYEERQRDFYRDGPRSTRSYADLDDELSRSDYRPGRTPDFLREDYGRTSAGPLVVRDRVASEDFERRRPAREIEKEELIIRDRRDSARPREIERDEVIYRRDEPAPRRPREVEETDVVVRRRESSRPPPPRSREVEREEIDIRRETREAPPRPREISRETREFEREDIHFRRGSGRPAREIEKDEFIYRRDSREGRNRERSLERERETLVIRPRERSLPPPKLVAREREDFVIRRRRSPSPRSPPPATSERKEEIIIRRTEREPTPSPPPPPPAPAPVEPVVRPPIIQEVITHHRHIDHGVERARSPTPPPPPPSPPKEESLEIAIRRRNTEGVRGFDEDIIYERETTERRSRDRDIQISRRRSLSAPRRRFEDDVHSEAEYYNRKAAERAYIGEAYNGATKDWAIVDVPPGTKRVRMDGVGGGSQEITWQRYNGVRRSKFITDDDVYAGDFGAPAPPAPSSRKKTDMWTEITKDLVIKEAIETMGYEYEETEFFYYVMEYLRYEDVLQLVEISDNIRRERRNRIREIQWEREEVDRSSRRPVDERIYEREYVYDHTRRGGRYR